MVGAPILAGLLVAPSWAGVGLAIAVAGAFLTRQPLRLALADVRKGKRYPRTAWAIRFSILYGVIGCLGFVAALVLARGSFLAPLVIAAILGGIQFSLDLQGKGRSFFPECCGAVAMSLVAPAIAQAAAYPFDRSWWLSLVIGLQAITAISYAAARVRIARGVAVRKAPIILGHVAAAALIGGLAATSSLGWPVAAAFIVLLGRAAWGLSRYAKPVKAALVGIQEVCYTLLAVGALVLSMPRPR